MKIEKIVTKTSGRCLNVVASKVESLRINESVTSTVRVYDGGYIGVAGKTGKIDFEMLEQKAKENLSQGIAYPETHLEAITDNVDTTKTVLTEEELIPTIDKLLARLEKENPQFLFSNKVKLNNSERTLTDSDGRNLSYKGNNFVLSFAIKYKGSANIMDEFYGCESDYFDEDQICRDVKMKCDAFLTELPQIEEDEVTVIGDLEPLQYALSHLNAELYFNKASIFDGKLGEKIFDEKFSLTINRDPSYQLDLPHFDSEGTILPDYKFDLIKNGVLTGLVACRKTAQKYGIQTSGSTSAEYDGIPDGSYGGLDVEDTASELSELVSGKAVYLSVSSGGDMTPTGDVSMPVLVPYLYENGKLLGKLPEMTVTTNLFDAFGKDFVGICKKGLYEYGRNQYFVYKAKLVNKKA